MSGVASPVTGYDAAFILADGYGTSSVLSVHSDLDGLIVVAESIADDTDELLILSIEDAASLAEHLTGAVAATLRAELARATLALSQHEPAGARTAPVSA